MSSATKHPKQIFLDAVEHHALDQWPCYLDQVCGNDADLRRRVEVLLAAHVADQSLLDSPAIAPPATIVQPRTEAIGTVIGPYKLLQPIGEGGMGTVYLAEQTEPVERRVALKVIKPGMDSRQVIARFEAERQALALMDHPNIAKVLDAGTTDAGRPYFVMELVKGVPITRYCDEQHLTPRQRLELFVPVCQAVQHAHQKGVIHRDLKPSNVLIALYDGRPVPKVIDFGVAKATGHKLTEHTMFTELGQVVGTLEYMSPEQAEFNQLDIDTRSDIYSLGVLLYELLTGTTPFEKKRLKEAALVELLRIIREEEPQKPSTRLSTTAELASIAANRGLEPKRLSGLIRGDLDWIVMKALEKDRSRRYETANGFAADVLRYLADEPVSACPPSTTYRFGKFVRRNKRGLAVAGLVLAFLLLLGGSAGWTARERQLRAARAAERVDMVLQDVDRLISLQQWPEALASALRAEEVVSGGDADKGTRDRVSQVLDDLHMVRLLDDARYAESEFREGDWDRAGGDRAYARAFAECGIDIERMSVENAAAHLRRRDRIAIALATGLTHWARVRRTIRERDKVNDASWLHLLAVADAINPDRWRLVLREAWQQEGAVDRGRLTELTTTPAVHRLPPASVLLIADTVFAAGLVNQAAHLLRSAQRNHPDDFWINYRLAYYLWNSKPRRNSEAIAYLRAALAVRPENAAAWSNLCVSLFDQQNLEEATFCGRKAVHFDNRFVLAHDYLGLVLIESGKLDEAIACFQRSLALDPGRADAHCGLGNALYRQQKLAQAVERYRRAVELDPSHALAHTNLGTALRYLGTLDEAVQHCRKAVALDPHSAISQDNLGSVLWAQGSPHEAIECHRKAIELDPILASAHSNLGNALRETGQLNEAIAACRRAIELDPKLASAHNHLGNSLSDQGQLAQGIDSFHKAIALDPQNAQFHCNLGIAHGRLGNLNEAIRCYRQAIALNPNDADAHNNLGNVLSDQGKLDEAIECCRRAIELNPRHFEAYCSLGSYLCEQGQLEEAAGCHRKAIEIAPDRSVAHYNLGVVLYRQQQLEAAIQCYRQAIDVDPEFSRAHHNLGASLAEQGKFDEAIACYRNSIALDGQAVQSYHDLGIALEIKGELDAAIQCYRKAVELRPDYLDAYVNLGSVLARKGEVQEAIASCRKAIELDPTAGRAYMILGNALGDAGQPLEAIAAYRRVIELDPQDATPHNNLGLLLMSQGDLAAAIAAFQAAIDLDPDDPFAPHNLGVANYRSGKWQAARAAFDKSMERQGGDGYDWVFMAMVHWQLGNKDEARNWLDKAVDWVDKVPSQDDELRRLRMEAEELLEVKSQHEG